MEDRHKRIMRASAAGVVINFVFAALKSVIGAISGSVSVLTDAVNNLTDTLSATVTLVATRMAQKKPDREHPHGHGRIEYVAALIVGLIILSVGILAAFNSVPKIIEPKIVEYPIWAMIVIFVTVVVKLAYGRYLRKVGKATRSRSLEGSGVDALFDALLSLGTLIGAVVSMVLGVSIDGWIGLLIAVFIVKSAFDILSEGVTDIIGRKVDEKLTRKIREAIKEVPEVKGVKSLILHDYGPEDVSGAVKIEVSKRMTTREFEKVAEEIEGKVKKEFGVKLVVGI